MGLVLAVVLLIGGPAKAQTQPASPLDVVPDKMPFATPYGPPISLQQAQAIIQAPVNDATKRWWPGTFAVVDSSANLVAFARMDGSMLASISLAQHKAGAAVLFRRPAFEDAVQRSGYNYVLSLDGAIATRGGVLLIEDGKIVGGIGCSGGTGAQDEAICTAAAATINK
jgi:uncharacterized protein GlcG (DUF336 family)